LIRSFLLFFNAGIQVGQENDSGHVYFKQK